MRTFHITCALKRILSYTYNRAALSTQTMRGGSQVGTLGGSIRCHLLQKRRGCAGTSGVNSDCGGSCTAHEDVVTPWNVSAAGVGGIDYERVLTRFKSQPVDEPLLKKMEEVTLEGPAGSNPCRDSDSQCGNKGDSPPMHHFFRRGIAFSHRDFNRALDSVHSALRLGNHGAFLYTGRGPSARTMHLGHVLPFLLTRHLQEIFGLPLVIQITDDEKYFFRDIPLHSEGSHDAADIVVENIKDIIAFGLNPERTFIFRNTSYMGSMYPTVVRLQRTMTINTVKNTLGLTDSDNIGKVAFPATQAAPCFSSAFPQVLADSKRGAPLQCIVPCAIDQDPFFVLARAAAARLRYRPPALLHTKFLPALRGMKFKMSSSGEEGGVITLHDTAEQVQKKMRKAFSGGSGTLNDMKVKGVDLSVDVAYQYLYFFCPDDMLLDEVTRKYAAGDMNSGDVKDLAANVVVRHVLRDWQVRRQCVTDADVQHFTSIRNIMV
uniref:tryptophan--tRNA ligase n=1 Tax=Trypanosoma congolense (strain IL3000) TaxID=1068625 RepID=G0URJ3_TRYCI|nr:putative tryptophanyl-tRNA synthetase [Trypanosoma congolense IL3000]